MCSKAMTNRAYRRYSALVMICRRYASSGFRLHGNENNDNILLLQEPQASTGRSDEWMLPHMQWLSVPPKQGYVSTHT